MRETNKARQAFEDYYNLGPGRSLRILHKQYCQQTDDKPPTVRLKTIALWSTELGWQDRIAERDLEIAKTHLEVIKKKATETGYAVFWKRIHDLGLIAERIYKLLELGPTPPIMVREFRGLLDDIAKEMGERIKQEKHDVEMGGEVILRVIRDGDSDTSGD
jgi:hypothetical protein